MPTKDNDMDLSRLVCYVRNVERDRRRKYPKEDYITCEDTNTDVGEPAEKRRRVIAGEDLMKSLRSPEQLKLPNAFEMNDLVFHLYFDLDKILVEQLLIELSALTYSSALGRQHGSIPFDISVLATLSFLVHGSLDDMILLPTFAVYKKAALLRCVPAVCNTIVNFLAPTYISFPNSLSELSQNSKAFLEEFDVPGVVGVLDTFHVHVKKISEESKVLYTNLSGETSVKVQVVCDKNMRFLDSNPRYPGGRSDIFIWKRSHIRNIMKNLYEKDKSNWLVADRGYHLEPSVINPYRNAKTHEQKLLNDALDKAHGVLDKAINVLKTRFSCLNTRLTYGHKDCANIITSCITLHNFMLAKGCSVERNLDFVVPKKNKLPNATSEDVTAEGRANREFMKDFILNNNNNVQCNSIK